MDEDQESVERPWRDIAVLWGAAAAAGLVAAAVLVVLGVVERVEQDGAVRLLLSTAVPFAAASAGVLLLAPRLRPEGGWGLGLRRPERRWWLLVPVLLIALLVANTALSALLGAVVPQAVPAVEPLFGAADASGVVVAALLVGVVLGPLLEELLFRGVLQRALTRRFSIAVALPVTAVLFTVWHGEAAAHPHLLGGLAYGWIFHRSGSLWPAIALHAADNALSFALRLILVGHL